MLGGVPGVPAANVVIIGGGIVGTEAAKMAVGLGAKVTIIDRNLDRLRQLDDIFLSKVQTLASSRYADRRSDLACRSRYRCGPGRRCCGSETRHTRHAAPASRTAAVLVDVAVDQGGCFETTHATTHSNPTYYEEGVLHYCVANMPGAVPRTSTFALTNATLPYALDLANKGFESAIAEDAGLYEGVNTYAGKLTYEAVATSQGLEYTPLDTLLDMKVGIGLRMQ